KGRQGAYPAVQFELAGPRGRGDYVACARLPQLPARQQGDEVEAVSAWYHVADFRRGDPARMGALQFLQGPDGTVYYRAYGKDGLKAPGAELDVTDPERSVALPFTPMDMRLQVLAHLPHAAPRPGVVPRHLRPGADPVEGLEPALRCTLAAGGQETEFWVRLARQATRVRVGDALFFVRYRTASRRTD